MLLWTQVWIVKKKQIQIAHCCLGFGKVSLIHFFFSVRSKPTAVWLFMATCSIFLKCEVLKVVTNVSLKAGVKCRLLGWLFASGEVCHLNNTEFSGVCLAVPSSPIFNMDLLLPLTAVLVETVCSHTRCWYSTKYHKAASRAAKKSLHFLHGNHISISDSSGGKSEGFYCTWACCGHPCILSPLCLTTR